MPPFSLLVRFCRSPLFRLDLSERTAEERKDSRVVLSLQTIRVAAKVMTFAAVLGMLPSSASAQRVAVTLKNGMIISPVLGAPISSVKLKAKASGAGQNTASIAEMDDGLRLTLVNNNLVQGEVQVPVQTKIEFPANARLVASPSNTSRVGVFTAASTVSQFSVLGRRFYRFDSGEIVVQGITEITPQYVRLESLRGATGALAWDMRMSLDSMPPKMLYDILLKNTDINKSNSFLDVVSLYRASGKYIEAREVAQLALQLFPEEENYLKSIIKQLDQLAVDQVLAMVQNLKNKAGQHKFAEQILNSIATDSLSLENSIQIKSQKDTLTKEQAERDSILNAIKTDIEQLQDPQAQQDCREIWQEMESYLNQDTLPRLSDYMRLKDDSKLESRIALAVGGWIYGSGLAEENLKLILSGIRAKKLVHQYLSAPSPNDATLDELIKLESGSPRYVARIVANMAPPMPPPDSMLKPVSYYPDPSNPEVVAEKTVPGRYEIRVPLPREMAGIEATYVVQLPPEYNPYRRYPCVVTMNGQVSNPEEQVNWWCGPIDPQSERGWGEASKNGFIVVAPYWRLEKQPSYNYTENEHYYVLAALMDAKRRFSIDNDRVYLSGHHIGGDGAWDIATAHPDLWAGCVVICGIASKYVTQYLPNTRYVPHYFVTGELAAKGTEVHREVNSLEWDKLLQNRSYDTMLTIYNGRGFDHFLEELPRIFEWMNLANHVRNVNITEFEIKTNRLGDRFFWWFETDQLKEGKNINHPLLFTPGTEHTVESEIIREPNNVIMMKTAPADRFSIWLNPDLVDLSRSVQVTVKGKNERYEPNADTRVLMNDVRTRCDRQHPFWMKVDFPK
ncbi:MAG: hypothetical protein ACK5T6_17725 [Pirellula sp.]|jgi:pimeloyl-ACP methyl ester carboxylesterase